MLTRSQLWQFPEHCAIAAEPVGDDLLGQLMVVDQPALEAPGSTGIALLLQQNIQNFTVRADGSPEPTTDASDKETHPIIEGIDTASYATVTFEGEIYTFALADSGRNKNEVVLELADTAAAGASLVSDTSTITLTELLDGLAANPGLLEQLQSGTQVS